MIELRWVARWPWDTPRLQWRTAVAVDASGALCPGEFGPWLDAPFVVTTPSVPVPDAAPQETG